MGERVCAWGVSVAVLKCECGSVGRLCFVCGKIVFRAKSLCPQVPLLKSTIVAMSASKLNTFHWHITDAQSFPLQLHSLPALAAQVGAPLFCLSPRGCDCVCALASV